MRDILATLSKLSAAQATPAYTDNASILSHMSDALHQSVYRVLSLLIAILPGILAFFVALVVFTLIGMGISAVLRRILAGAKFDERLARGSSDVDWTPGSSPTELAARASFWGCVLLGLMIGVSAFDTSYAFVDVMAATHPILVPALMRRMRWGPCFYSSRAH